MGGAMWEEEKKGWTIREEEGKRGRGEEGKRGRGEEGKRKGWVDERECEKDPGNIEM